MSLIINRFSDGNHFNGPVPLGSRFPEKNILLVKENDQIPYATLSSKKR
jgi:hypothetical protein